MMKDLADADHLPDYRVVLEDDIVLFRNRATERPKADVRYPILYAETYHDAKLVAPGYDVYALEREWRNWWVDSGRPELGFPAKAFVGFCKSRYQRKPNP